MLTQHSFCGAHAGTTTWVGITTRERADVPCSVSCLAVLPITPRAWERTWEHWLGDWQLCHWTAYPIFSTSSAVNPLGDSVSFYLIFIMYTLWNILMFPLYLYENNLFQIKMCTFVDQKKNSHHSYVHSHNSLPIPLF